MSETVIREVTNNVWTFSRPFSLFNLLPIGGRSTAVKLSDGGVWVLASTALDAETKAKLDELGPVKYIIGPNAVHSLFLGDFKKAYPNAKLIGVEELTKKPHLADFTFDGVYGKDPEGTRYGFEDEIKSCFFSGHRNKDLAFIHVKSETLIEADLLFNMPCREQFSRSSSSGSIPIISGFFSPYSVVHKRFLWRNGINKEVMKRDSKTVAGWDFDRVIPCHGEVIDTGGKKAWMEAHKWYLQ